MRGWSAKGSLGLTGQVFTVVPYKNDVVSAVYLHRLIFICERILLNTYM